MFHSTSLVPVEGIMTMIRAIKIDHGPYQECPVFGIYVVLGIRCKSNDNNLGMVSKKKKKLMEFSIKLAGWVLDALVSHEKKTKTMLEMSSAKLSS